MSDRFSCVEADQRLAIPTENPAPEGFAVFVAERRAQLIRLAWAVTGDRELAEDVTQIALERLWRRWGSLPHAEGERWAYAQRVLISQVSTWRRRLWTKNEIPTAAMPREQVSGTGAELDSVAVLDWLAELPKRQRAVVVLRYLSDLSVADTAKVLDCSPGTVKSQTAKAMAKLRLTHAERTDEADD